DLNKAYSELILKPSKNKLDDLIKKAEALDSSQYTKKSWKALEKALASAKKTFDNEESTKKEVKDAEDWLEVAIEKLELKDNGSDTGSGTDTDTGNGKGNGKLPNTGGTPAAAIGLIGIITTATGFY
ncbi:hypothetical protein GNF67_19875, partial [Clostridium perfringens]|nr:hypothetical protein [Clostridium perfringens]